VVQAAGVVLLQPVAVGQEHQRRPRPVGLFQRLGLGREALRNCPSILQRIGLVRPGILHCRHHSTSLPQTWKDWESVNKQHAFLSSFRIQQPRRSTLAKRCLTGTLHRETISLRLGTADASHLRHDG
jgi:hypothetical protein